MRSAVLILVLMTSACVLPKTELTRTPGARRLSDPIVDRKGKLELTTRRDGSRITITAEHADQCRREVHQITTVTETKKGKLVGGGGLTVLLVIAYPVGLASLAVSAIANSQNGTKTHEVDEVIAGQPEACRTPASRLVLRVGMPSGSVVGGVTDERGVLELDAPDEPPGTVRVVALEEIEMGAGRPGAR